MKSELFHPSGDGEARILLLIEEFSHGRQCLEGRTKLAKLDFLLRYPSLLPRALASRGRDVPNFLLEQPPDVESRMVRYRYGPWDPSYFAILGRLIGKQLVAQVPGRKGVGYRVTPKGRSVADQLRREPAWHETRERLTLLRRHFNLSGTALKKLVYETFPEVTRASWGDTL
jgi:hypothetical protein